MHCTHKRWKERFQKKNIGRYLKETLQARNDIQIRCLTEEEHALLAGPVEANQQTCGSGLAHRSGTLTHLDSPEPMIVGTTAKMMGIILSFFLYE